MAKLSKEVAKTQELFSKIVDTDVYSINDINGKEQKMTGVELKAYMVSMRGQIDFTELVVVEYKTHLFKAGSGINSGDEEADLLAIFVCDIRSEQWWSSRGVVISVSIFVSILSLIYVSVHSLVYVVVIHLV